MCIRDRCYRTRLNFFRECNSQNSHWKKITTQNLCQRLVYRLLDVFCLNNFFRMHIYKRGVDSNNKMSVTTLSETRSFLTTLI